MPKVHLFESKSLSAASNNEKMEGDGILSSNHHVRRAWNNTFAQKNIADLLILFSYFHIFLDKHRSCSTLNSERISSPPPPVKVVSRARDINLSARADYFNETEIMETFSLK